MQAQHLIPEAISTQLHCTPRLQLTPLKPGEGARAKPAVRMRSHLIAPLPGVWVLLSRLESPTLRMAAPKSRMDFAAPYWAG